MRQDAFPYVDLSVGVIYLLLLEGNLSKTKTYFDLSLLNHILACFLLSLFYEPPFFQYPKEVSPMNMIFYSPIKGRLEDRLHRVIDSVVPSGDKAGVYRDIEQLSQRLLQPKNDLTIAVLLAGGRADLINLVAIGDLFRDVRIIVIAPDRDKETVSLAHRLRPRLLTYMDSDFAEVFAVLTNLLGEHHSLTHLYGKKEGGKQWALQHGSLFPRHRTIGR
jgi:hypothetical protein